MVKIALTPTEQSLLHAVKVAPTPLGVPQLCAQLHLTQDEVYHAAVFLVAAHLLHPFEGQGKQLLLRLPGSPQDPAPIRPLSAP